MKNKKVRADRYAFILTIMTHDFSLLSEEVALFSLLLDCIQWQKEQASLKSSNNKCTSIGDGNTILRVAGGWVRDKVISASLIQAHLIY